MLEIGIAKTRQVRIWIKNPDGTRKTVPKLDANGNVETATTPATTRRITRKELDGSFLKDRGRKLVVSLQAGDLLVLRPYGTKYGYQATLHDIYRWMIQCAANRKVLEKARETKANKAKALAAARVRRAENRLRRPLTEPA